MNQSSDKLVPQSAMELKEINGSSEDELKRNYDSFPCVSAYDDEHLRDKNKLPYQLAEKWRKAALAVSYGSIVATLLLGVTSFVLSTIAGSSAAFAVAFDSLLDMASSFVVVWRFSGKDGHSYSWQRERRACIAIACCFILSAMGVCVEAVHFLASDTEPHRADTLAIASAVGLIAFAMMAWLKYIIADKLKSESLRTDAFNSLAGAGMSLGMVISSLVYKENDSIWFLDASVGLLVAIALFVYGIRLLIHLYSPWARAQETGNESDEDT